MASRNPSAFDLLFNHFIPKRPGGSRPIHLKYTCNDFNLYSIYQESLINNLF